MISKSDLKDILKENNIIFFSYLDKKQLIDLAKEHGVLPGAVLKRFVIGIAEFGKINIK